VLAQLTDVQRAVTETQAEKAFGSQAEKDGPDDTRSPLERFRSRKPLSVSDLVAPAWCELQYWYSLTKYGRKKRTVAMKEGSKVHKKIEEEVMGVAEPVETQTREDGFGLRIWNIIQSLRLLRATGTTRELEVWGFVDGQLVNGVIDELSFTCSDDKLEATLASSSPRKRGRKKVQLDIAQPIISQFFVSGSQRRSEELETAVDQDRKLYLTDLKTRVGTSLPSVSSLRPTKMQLMLYRRLLVDLASNNIDASKVFERYKLNHTAELSNLFIESIGGIETNLGPGIAGDAFAEVQTMSSTVVELLQHRTLPLLWQLMIQEYNLTLPLGATNISRVLRAQFVSQKNNSVIGDRTFVYEEAVLEGYTRDEMAWWKGERTARGVEIEDAFKCGICEFAEGCEWRQGKMAEAVQKSREKKKIGRPAKAAG
jgi:exonuclease V